MCIKTRINDLLEYSIGWHWVWSPQILKSTYCELKTKCVIILSKCIDNKFINYDNNIKKTKKFCIFLYILHFFFFL